LKNQDPTSASDPNEYVNQLVAVNSLEQLISINSTLTDALDSTTTSSNSTKSTTVNANEQTTEDQSVDQNTQSLANSSNSQSASAIQAATSQLAPGNLSIPATNFSAKAIAQALSGQH
jgi:flagellar basal-body rod modification protein FlgD